jgi:small subunit ribosomal protein S11
MTEEKITKQDIEKAKEKLKEKIEKQGIEEVKKEEQTNSNTSKTSNKNKEKLEVESEINKKKIKEEDKSERKERIGVLNIYTTFNNTLMILTDMAGRTLARFSGGQSTKQSRLKANPTVAMFISQRIAEEAKDNRITGFYVKIRAETGENNPGPGAHAAIKSLTRAGFKILSIMDSTRTPRGGPKKPYGRRGRRV